MTPNTQLSGKIAHRTCRTCSNQPPHGHIGWVSDPMGTNERSAVIVNASPIGIVGRRLTTVESALTDDRGTLSKIQLILGLARLVLVESIMTGATVPRAALLPGWLASSPQWIAEAKRVPPLHAAPWAVQLPPKLSNSNWYPKRSFPRIGRSQSALYSRAGRPVQGIYRTWWCHMVVPLTKMQYGWLSPQGRALGALGVLAHVPQRLNLSQETQTS